jgi:hypothetical protein
VRTPDGTQDGGTFSINSQLDWPISSSISRLMWGMVGREIKPSAHTQRTETDSIFWRVLKLMFAVSPEGEHGRFTEQIDWSLK